MATNNEKLQELSVEEKLQHLYELQRIDTEIDKIKTLRGELPLEVQDLEDEIAGLETRLENLKNEISEADKSVTNKKQEITKSEELIKKYSEQLDNVRNNREYDALTKEVEFQKLEIELQQKRIREAQKLKAEKEVNLEISNKQYTEKKADSSGRIIYYLAAGYMKNIVTLRRNITIHPFHVFTMHCLMKRRKTVTDGSGKSGKYGRTGIL